MGTAAFFLDPEAPSFNKPAQLKKVVKMPLGTEQQQLPLRKGEDTATYSEIHELKAQVDSMRNRIQASILDTSNISQPDGRRGA